MNYPSVATTKSLGPLFRPNKQTNKSYEEKILVVNFIKLAVNGRTIGDVQSYYCVKLWNVS